MTEPRAKKGGTAGAGSAVDALLAGLTHPQKDEILALRNAILASDPAITEHVKWNAPSFCHGADDRVTFRLPPRGGAFQLVFHRGAKAKPDPGFSFPDASGLLAWAAPDRGVVTLASAAEAEAKRTAIVALVGAWMRATA
jgi:hypothetical protein